MRSRVKVIIARQFKGTHERCVKAALEDPAHLREFSRVSMVNTFEVEIAANSTSRQFTREICALSTC